MNKTQGLWPALPLIFGLSACSEYEDPQTVANDTPQFEQMQCHKPHPIPFREKSGDNRQLYHPISERPLAFNDASGEIKDEFKTARKLWSTSSKPLYTSFEPKAYKPDSSHKVREALLDKGYLVIGCASKDGATEDANFNLSYLRASTMSHMIAEKIVDKQIKIFEANMLKDFSTRMDAKSAQNAVQDFMDDAGAIDDMRASMLQKVLSEQMCTVPLGTSCSSMGVSNRSGITVGNDRSADDRFVKTAIFELAQ